MLTVNQACVALGVGRSKLYELIRQGRLEATDINGVEKTLPGERGPRRSLRIKQAEIDAFIDRNKATA